MSVVVGGAQADELVVKVNHISEKGVEQNIGTIKLTDSKTGLIITPNLKQLTPGLHGFHVHQNPECGTKEKDGKMTAGLAAGGHYDPTESGKHAGPIGHGHMGDLPAIEVAGNGRATKSMTVARLKVEFLQGRSLMIHEGGDNYSDQPKPLGGGGSRVACAIVK